MRLLDANSARATTTFHELARGPSFEDGPFGPKGTVVNLENFGIYFDDISHVDDSWKFSRRLVVLTYMGMGTATGEVVAKTRKPEFPHQLTRPLNAARSPRPVND